MNSGGNFQALKGSHFDIHRRSNDSIGISAESIKFSAAKGFQNIHQLQHLELICYTTSAKCLSSLPETVTLLHLYFLKLSASQSYKSQSYNICLPIYLQNLSSSDIRFPKISNVDELTELTVVDIALSSCTDSIKIYPHQYNKALTGMTTLIHDSSPTIKNFFLFYSISPSKPFSFPSLSVFPPSLSSLKLSFFESLKGQFPSTLRSLVVDLTRYKSQFSYFWRKFVACSQNLIHLKVISFDECDKIDFTELQFPLTLSPLSW
ncbi:unnamed protein product [Ambrosiozyma monospora]|uniref:Unnamed protein product n=1 Tax=Ambrosiozyma monospora TaxID=43982 RepID=A0ACB5T587_AMBMO|nr:unnamed protein product [Ambrosiozyma monospora]